MCLCDNKVINGIHHRVRGCDIQFDGVTPSVLQVAKRWGRLRLIRDRISWLWSPTEYCDLGFQICALYFANSVITPRSDNIYNNTAYELSFYGIPVIEIGARAIARISEIGLGELTQWTILHRRGWPESAHQIPHKVDWFKPKPKTIPPR